MALKQFSTLPLGVIAEQGGINLAIGYRTNWCGGVSPALGGAKVSEITVNGGSNDSTNGDGNGFSITGNAFADQKVDGLLAKRNGQQAGRVVVVIGNRYFGSGDNNYYKGDAKGCHIRNTGGVQFRYTNADAYENRYAANVSRIMLMYAAGTQQSSNNWKTYVFDATVRLPGSANLGHIATGDTDYSYSLSSADKAKVVDEKMTLEGICIVFEGNEAPGCCKSRDVAGRVWQVTPVQVSDRNGSINTNAPYFRVIPPHPDNLISEDRVATRMMRLSREP